MISKLMSVARCTDVITEEATSTTPDSGEAVRN